MCDVTPDTTAPLPADPPSPGLARRLLETAHCPTHSSAVLETAKWLASELVTNAVLHADPPIEIHISCIDTAALEVAVLDGSSALPTTGALHDTYAEGGRGITLVDLLSDAWGVKSNPTGKQVWFQLRTQTGLAVERAARLFGQ
jgi:anti-sigma regulatory factor (Ser/Thr protein kinase)